MGLPYLKDCGLDSCGLASSDNPFLLDMLACKPVFRNQGAAQSSNRRMRIDGWMGSPCSGQAGAASHRLTNLEVSHTKRLPRPGRVITHIPVMRHAWHVATHFVKPFC